MQVELVDIQCAIESGSSLMARTRRKFFPTIPSSKGCGRLVLILPGAPLQNIGRRCEFRHPCSDGAKNPRQPVRNNDAP